MNNKNLLSSNITKLTESATLAMTQKSRELKAQGVDVINLSIGEPDFNTPEFVKEAAKKAIDENFSHYPPVPGIPELRQAISEKLKRENNLVYTPEQIVVSTGAKQSLANVITCLIDSGEEVIIPAPYWVSYVDLVKISCGESVIIPTTVETDFKITPEQLEKAITNKTKMLLFSSPCNPSGSLYTIEELEAIARVIAKHENIFILSDEIYEYINFTGKPHASIASFDFIKDRVIVVNGVSKGFAMTGWRIGYIAAPLWISKACTKLQGQITSGTCSIAQKAATAAIKSGICADVIKMREAFLKRRDLVLGLANEIPNFKTTTPLGAFYIFADISHYLGKNYGSSRINDSDDLALYLLNEAHVASVGGTSFGNPDCIRFSYATSEEQLVEAFKRVKNALSKLD